MSEDFLDKGDMELDEFLKKISDDAEIPFSEEDWKAMESRLDESVKPTPIFWMRNMLLGALILSLAGLVGYFVWNQQGVSPSENSNPAITEIPTSSLKEDLIKENPTNREEGITSSRAADILSATDSKQSNVRNPAPVSGLDQTIKKVTNDPTSATNNSAFAEGPSVIQSNEASKDALLNSETTPENNRKDEEPALPVVASTGDSIALSSPISTELEEKEKQPKSYFQGRFNISFQFAPDLSAIQIDQFGKAGNMIGLGAEYFVLPKLSLSSGIFYSYKPYSGDSGYHLNYGNDPTYIIGACDILDLPLNLKFYALEGKVQRFFISTGVSTYLMLKEKYELEYYNQTTGEPYVREITVQGANQHYFGIANFSVGYERKLGRQLGIQVEPYFKVPFSGVGEGDVSLKSTGIFVGLKYYPGKR